MKHFSCSIIPSMSVFSSGFILHIRWLKYWSSSFSISPSNEYSGLISFRLTGLSSLQSKGLSSLFQNHSSKVSILRHSAFLVVQLSHFYLTTGKTIAFITWVFVGKVTSLLFNMLPKLVITFLPRSKCFNVMAAVTICSDFGAHPPPKKKKKNLTVSIVSQ